MEIPNLNNVIKVYECWNEPYTPDHRNKCQKCPYGYGYFDDSGDTSFWTCNEEKWEEDAYFYLKLYQHLTQEKSNNNGE